VSIAAELTTGHNRCGPARGESKRASNAQSGFDVLVDEGLAGECDQGTEEETVNVSFQM